MNKDIVAQYLKICKKYDYQQISRNEIEPDELKSVNYVKSLGKSEYIYNKYHEMKSGGGGGGKGKKSKKNNNNNNLSNSESTENNTQMKNTNMDKIINEVENQFINPNSKLSIILKDRITQIIGQPK